MPEGPSIVLVREELARFARRRVLRASGTANIDLARLEGKSIRRFRSWGKHLLLDFGQFAIRIHFLMFGSHTVDHRKPRPERLRLEFQHGDVNFYTCAVREISEPLDEVYDWGVDVLSDEWDATAARRRLRKHSDALICDALLDQELFAGVGNIMKNEILFRTRVHPASRVAALPPAKLRAIVEQTRAYSFDFLAWKRAGVLKKHWQVHTRRTCPNCGGSLDKAHLGLTKRRTFWCERCQVRYERRRAQ